MVERCVERGRSGLRGQLWACANKGKVERDGKWYCGVHDPEKRKARVAANTAKWEADTRLARHRRDYATLREALAGAALAWYKEPQSATVSAMREAAQQVVAYTKEHPDAV